MALFDLPNAKDQPDHGIKFLRAGAVAINFMSWSRMHPIVGQIFLYDLWVINIYRLPGFLQPIGQVIKSRGRKITSKHRSMGIDTAKKIFEAG